MSNFAIHEKTAEMWSARKWKRIDRHPEHPGLSCSKLQLWTLVAQKWNLASAFQKKCRTSELFKNIKGLEAASLGQYHRGCKRLYYALLILFFFSFALIVRFIFVNAYLLQIIVNLIRWLFRVRVSWSVFTTFSGIILKSQSEQKAVRQTH